MKGEQMNVIDFLDRAKNSPETLDLGKNVVVVGGGNTAMDAARTAKRARGVEKVSIVYRRTKKYMPAEEEELELAIADGVEFCELLSPVEHKGGTLVCHRMILGSPDRSGRRKPVETDETVEVKADTVIAAVGEQIDTELFTKNGVALDEKGRVVYDEKTGMTSVPGVYVAGDALRGPATVVEAIADARRYADSVRNMLNHDIPDGALVAYREACAKKGILREPKYPSEQNKRCLVCPVVCEICTDVCPNRANVSVKVPGKDMPEILHVDVMCNYCGNCATFCPYDSAPYKEKFTLYHSVKEFEGSDSAGFVVLNRDRRLVRVREKIGGPSADFDLTKDNDLNRDAETLILTVFNEYSYLL
jgi:putative selenate reductase